MKAYISGIGHSYPEKRLANADLEKMVDTSDEWITTRTGIKERRILEKGIGVSHMAADAAQMILSDNGISAADIDAVFLATVTPDMPVPSAAALVQRKLNADRAWGFDINGGCTGFLHALATGAQFIETGRCRKVLVIGADKMSSIIDYRDRNTCVIFGDGAGAVLLEPAESGVCRGIVDFDLHMDGAGADSLYVAAGGSRCPASPETVRNRQHFVYQDGRAVFKRAVTEMAKVSGKLLERNGLTHRELRYLVPHQANMRIIDAVSRKLELSPEQVIINIEKYGNTTAATIPLAMSEAFREGRFSSGDWLLLSAFGAGFTWGSLLVQWGNI